MDTLDTREIRAAAARRRARLTQPGARCPKREALTLLGQIERLVAELDQARAELRELKGREGPER